MTKYKIGLLTDIIMNSEINENEKILCITEITKMEFELRALKQKLKNIHEESEA